MPHWLIWLLVFGMALFAAFGLGSAMQRRRRIGHGVRRRQASTGSDASVPGMTLHSGQPARTPREGDGHGQDSPSSDGNSSDGGGGD